MSEPYIGEIRMFGATYAPAGWLACDGQHVFISDYTALYTLIGTTYGGDGVNTFALPDLRGRTPIGFGTSNLGSTYVVGEAGGQEAVTLTTNQIASHGIPTSSSPRSRNRPVIGTGLATGGAYAPAAAANSFLRPFGGSQPHDNMPPFLVVTFGMAWVGIFPAR